MTGAHKEDQVPGVTFGTSLSRLAASATRRYTPPRLSPELTYDLDAERHYARWKSSPEADTFHRLDAAGQSVLVVDEVSKRCWQTLIKANAAAYEARAAVQEATPLITDHADALSIVWESLDAPFSLPPLRTVDESMPYYAGFRALARLLAMDAGRRVQQSDGDGALEACRVGIRFGLQVMQGSNLLGRLVGLAIQQMCRRFLWGALPHASPPALKATGQELETALVRAFPFSETVTIEGHFLLGNLLRGWETSSLFECTTQPASDLPLHLATLFRGKQHIFDNYVAYLNAWKERENGPYRAPSEMPIAPPPLSPSVFGDTYFTQVLQTTQNRLALAALALHQYRAERQV